MRFRLKNKSYVLNTKIKLVGKDGANLSIITSDINNPTSNYNLTANTITFCLSPLPAVIGDPEVIITEYTTSGLDFENGLIDKIPTTIWNKSGTADITSTNKIFGDNSFETKALGESLYTNSNVITGGSTPFTIEFYALIKGSSKNASGYNEFKYPLIAKNNNSAGGEQIFSVNSNMNLCTWRASAFEPSFANTTSFHKIRLNEIDKHTISYDGSSIRWFVNDKLESITGTLNGIRMNGSTPFTFYNNTIPNYPAHNTTTHGLLDNINIFDGVATKVRDYDPYEEFLVVDLAFDGENNSTKIVDNAKTKSEIPSSNLISELDFDNSLLDNISGLQWNSSGVVGYENDSLKFNGNTRIVSQNIININSSNVTIEFIINFYDLKSSYTGIFDVYGLSGLYFRLGSNNAFQLICNTNTYIGSDYIVQTNINYKISIVRNGTSLYWFVNGSLIGYNENINLTDYNMALGYNTQDPSNSYFYISKFKVHDKALYQPKSFRLDENNIIYLNNWTVNGNAKISTAQKFDGFSSLDCTVNGSYIATQTDLDFRTSDYTISFDFYPTSNAYTMLFSINNLNARFTINPSNRIYTDLDSTQTGTINTVNLNANNSCVIIFYKDYDYVDIYLNGILTKINISKSQLTPSDFRIGHDIAYPNNTLKGYIKNFKIYKDVAIPPKQKITSLINVNISSSGVSSNLTWNTSNASVNIDYFTGYLLNTSGNNAFTFYGSNFTLKYKFKGYGNLLREWNANLRYMLSINSNGVVSFSFYEAGPTQRTIATNSQTLSSDINELELTRLNGYFFIKLNGIPYTVTQTGAPYSGGIYGPTTEGVRLGDTGVTTYSIDIYTEKSEDLDKIQLDFDNNVIDRYGNSTWTNNGVTFNNVHSVKGSSIYTSGTQNIVCGANNNFNYGNSDFLIETDVKQMNKGSQFSAVLSNNNNYGTPVLTFGGTQSKFALYKDSGSSATHNIGNWEASDYTVIDNVYYNIKFMRKGSNLIFKKNDIVVGISNVALSGLINFNMNNYTAIGPAGSYNNAFNGYIDNFKSIKNYTDEVIIDKPALHLPLETNSINCGVTSLTINSVGNPTYTTIDGKKCIKFEKGKYLSINSNNIFNLGASSDFYIEFDIYPLLSTTVSDSFQAILSNNNAWSSTFQSTQRFSMSINQSTNSIAFDLGARFSTGWLNIISLNEWNKITLSKEQNKVIFCGYEFYVNADFNLSISNLFIGVAGWDSSRYFVDGYMSNFKMFVGTSEIPETYNDKTVLDLDFKPTRKSYLFKDNNNKCVIHPVNIEYRDYLDSQYCCTLNGTNQYLQLGKNDAFNFGLDDFIIEIDFETYIIDGNNRLLFNNASTNNNYRAYLAICSTSNTNPKKLEFGISNGSGTYYAFRSDEQLEINTRYKLVIKSENGLISMIINSVIQSMTLLNTNSVNFNYNSNTFIGADPTVASNKFNGTIYSIKIFRNTSDLSVLGTLVPEIPQPDPYWNNVVAYLPLVNDYSDIKGNTWSVIGTPDLTTDPDPFGNNSSIRLNNTSCIRSNLPNIDSQAFTVEFWIKPLSYGGVIFECGPQSGGSVRLIHQGGGKLTIQYYQWWSNSVYNVGNLPLNVWTHVAVQRAWIGGNNTHQIFIAGVKVGEVGAYEPNFYSSYLFTLGADQYNTGMSDAYFSHLRVTHGVARYNDDFIPPTKVFPTY